MVDYCAFSLFTFLCYMRMNGILSFMQGMVRSTNLFAQAFDFCTNLPAFTFLSIVSVPEDFTDLCLWHVILVIFQNLCASRAYCKGSTLVYVILVSLVFKSLLQCIGARFRWYWDTSSDISTHFELHCLTAVLELLVLPHTFFYKLYGLDSYILNAYWAVVK